MKVICFICNQTINENGIQPNVRLSQNISSINHKTSLRSKNIFFLTKQLVWILVVSLAVILSGCENGDGTYVDTMDERLDCGKGEIFGVIIHYGDALNADEGGSYSVEIKNPNNKWRDIIIWETSWSHKNVKEKDRNYTFMFNQDNFRTQFAEWTKYQDMYKNEKEYIYEVIVGFYDLIIRNSFGYEKKTTVRVGINQDFKSCNILFEPAIMEFSVP